MEKYAWRAVIIKGQEEEYKRRHDNIWPELKEELKNAGIRNYTIWKTGNELFGYYECEKGVDFACDYQAKSAVVDKWNKYMESVMIMPLDEETGAQPKLEKLFEFNA